MGESAPSPGRLLVTAFEPFGDDPVNSSQRVLEEISGSHDQESCELIACVLPVNGKAAVDKLVDLVERHDPCAVLCLGQDTVRDEISIEKVAINYCSYRIPDNAGSQPDDEPVEADGPAAYFSTLPIPAILDDVCQTGLSAEVSYSAGTFVCNYLFYSLMHYLAQEPRRIPAGFIHLPGLPEQEEQSCRPGIPLDRQVKVVQAMLRSVTGVPNENAP